MMKLDSNAPDISVIRSRLRYDPAAGKFYMLKSAGRRKSGYQAGYADRLGYIKVCVNGRWMMAHRLAWLFINGQWPDGEIDHINGDPSDNRIENLRECSRSQNVSNAKFNSLNTTGFRGVSRIKRKTVPDRYQATVRKDGVTHYIGTFATPEEAHAEYIKAAVSVHGEYFAMDGQQVTPPAPAAVQEVLL